MTKRELLSLALLLMLWLLLVFANTHILIEKIKGQ